MKPLDRSILTFFILPLAGLALACGPSAYDLRGPALKAGQIVQNKSRSSMPAGTLTIEMRGRTESASIESEDQSVTELEVVEVDEQGLKTLKRSVPEDWTRRVIKADLFSEDATEDNPMAGTRVLVERAANGYTQTLLDRQADGAQKRILAQAFEAPAAAYPPRKVKVGESWTVEGPALSRLLGEEGALSVSGSGTFTLDRVSEVDGERRAFLSFRLETSIKSLDEDNEEVERSLGGSGTIERSLDRGLDVKNNLSGQVRMVSRRTLDRDKATFTMAGPVTIEASERFVTGGERHAVALKGKPEPARTAPPRPAKTASPRPSPDVVPVAAVSRSAAPDTSPRRYSLTAQGASISRWAANGDPNAMLASHMPPDASVQVSVDGSVVLTSFFPQNNWEPYWGQTTIFDARPDSRVRIAVFENDIIDDSSRLLADWSGTLAELRKKQGRLAFGAVERLSFELSAY